MQNKLAEIKYQTEYIKKCGSYKLLECPDKEYMRLLAESGILNEGRHMVLDLGCGTGAFGLRLARLGFPVVGIDISTLSIKVAAHLAKKRNVNADFIVADVEKMPFRDRAFRLVFCGFVLHHMPNVLTYIMQEINRILALGGKLFLCEPNAFNLGCFITYHFGKNLTDLTSKERALNPKELVGFLALSGFVSINFKDISAIEHISRDSVSSLSEMAHRVIDIALRGVSNLLFMPGGGHRHRGYQRRWVKLVFDDKWDAYSYCSLRVKLTQQGRLYCAPRENTTHVCLKTCKREMLAFKCFRPMYFT